MRPAEYTSDELYKQLKDSRDGVLEDTAKRFFKDHRTRTQRGGVRADTHSRFGSRCRSQGPVRLSI